MHALAVLFCLAVHDEKLSVSRVEVNPDGVVWTADVALQGLEKILKFPADPLDLSERQLQGMKDEIVKYLKDAFAYAHKANGTLTSQNLMGLVTSAFGKEKVPRLSMATVATWHSYDHYGQMVVYARMNGVIPPASR